jgi:hypothetical protein
MFDLASAQRDQRLYYEISQCSKKMIKVQKFQLLSQRPSASRYELNE